MDREYTYIDIQLTPEERALILRYGYPFQEIEQSLQACETSTNIEVIAVSTFELERLIGDLCISFNDMQPGVLQDAVGALCDRMEYAQQTGDGMLFES
jgi:hypothetical protein